MNLEKAKSKDQPIVYLMATRLRKKNRKYNLV